MAGLVSMARSPEDLKKDRMYGTIMPVVDTDSPVYPYGLCLTLCDEELAKLGLDALCEVGDEITFTIRAEVTSVSANKTPDGEKNRLELQIVAMKALDAAPMMADGDADDARRSRYKGSSEA